MSVTGIGSGTLSASAQTTSNAHYNRAAESNANIGLLLTAEGYPATAASTSSSSGSTSFNPSTSAEASDAQLLGYLGYSPTLSPTAPKTTALGSGFNPAAASEGSDAELFAYEGYPAASAPSASYGTYEAPASTTPAQYGVGQYSYVSSLLNANVASAGSGVDLIA